jgi:hypothetical protein
MVCLANVSSITQALLALALQQQLLLCSMHAAMLIKLQPSGPRLLWFGYT